MAAAVRGRAHVIALLLSLVAELTHAQVLVVPTLSVRVFKPQGFELSIPDAPGIYQVDFYLIRSLEGISVLQGNGKAARVNGRWVIKVNGSRLVLGDTISFYVLATGSKQELLNLSNSRYLTADDVYSCEPGEFRCDTSQCKPLFYLCDGAFDCNDHSDEQCVNTNPGPCHKRAFHCISGDQCIPKRKQCNGQNDCADGSDEHGCAPPVVFLEDRESSPPCNPTEHPCVQQQLNFRLTAGDTLTLKCTAAGTPTPAIAWHRDKYHVPEICKVLTEEIDGGAVSTLSCPNMQHEYNGMYSCQAANVLGARLAAETANVFVNNYRRCSSARGFGDPPASCQPSATRVRGGAACSGDTIFEDHFNNLRTDLWQVEQYIPVTHPEYPFVSYQRPTSGTADTVISVSNGLLHIKPMLQEKFNGFNSTSISSGSLNLLNGCTGSSAEECYRQAPEIDILPPVVSGRLTSHSFAFTYGTVYIRAKLPQGDWIYPEILLEPLLKKYGKSNYASGVIKIASARGNKELRNGRLHYENNVLYGGPIMDYQCRYELIAKMFNQSRMWGDDFHEYSINWTPDQITLSVDGMTWFRVGGSLPLYQRLGKHCPSIPQELLSKGTTQAPFDDHFYLTLGVAVGGISEFPDEVRSSSYAGSEKPWVNTGHKAMLNFWQSVDSWYPTWVQPELVIDYVKVVAL